MLLLPAKKLLGRFARQSRGVAAVEFALVLPLMLLLLIGVAETTTALNQDRKVSQISSMLADLVAQSETVNSSDLADLVQYAATAVMEPYSSYSLDVIIASVSFDDDSKATVDWSSDGSGSAPWSEGSTPPIDIPEEIKLSGTSIIVGVTDYTYSPMFSSLTKNLLPDLSDITLSDTYFIRPRLTTKVTLEN